MFRYYSLVGLRAIPIVLPLLTLIRKKEVKYALITFVITQASKEIADKARNYLLKKSKELGVEFEIELVDFREFLARITDGQIEQDCYINLTPGMNWQVAKTILLFPKEYNVNILYQDLNTLYISNLNDSEKVFEKSIPLIDIGLSDYQELTGIYSFEVLPENKFPDLQSKLKLKQYRIKTDPIKLLKEYLGVRNISSADEIYYRNAIKNGLLLINQFLFHVREKNGFLYLYFYIDYEGLAGRKFINFYRSLLTLFPIQNYSSIIFFKYEKEEKKSTVESMINRLLSDGLYATNNLNRFMAWLKNPPAPFKVRPPDIQTQFNIDRPSFRARRVAIYSLGENVIPTIETLLSWKNVDLHLILYDETSARLTYLKEKLYQYFSDDIKNKYLNIFFIGTDNLGRNVLSKIRKILQECSGETDPEVWINITPGTKAHTIILSHLARNLNCVVNVYSIETKQKKFISLTNEVDTKDMHPINNTSLILHFYYTSKEADTQAISIVNQNLEFLRILYNKLLTGEYRIIQQKDLTKLIDKKEREVIQISQSQGSSKNDPKNTIIKLIHYDDKYGKRILASGRLPLINTNSNIIAKLWELIVFYRIRELKICNDNEIFYSIKWRDHKNTDKVHSEKDIVFLYKDYPVIIDCTILYQATSLIYKLIHNKGDNSRRFSRIHLTLIAVPYHSKAIKLPSMNLGILTVEYLENKEKFLEFLEFQLSRLRTID